MLEKCILTIRELNWNQPLGHKKTKLNIYLSSYAHVVHTTAKQVISRRRKNENVFKMSKDEKCTCKACKNTVFHCQICKFVGFLLPSWLLKLSHSSEKTLWLWFSDNQVYSNFKFSLNCSLTFKHITTASTFLSKLAP